MAIRIPGVIVRIVNDTGIVAPPLYQRYPVIIGLGDAYRQVSDQEVVRSLGSVDTIPASSPINSIVSVGDLPGIASYTSGTDYSLYGTSYISWTPGGSAPTTGDSFFVTYTENRPASAYTPTLYLDENLIYADHGNASMTNGVINDVSVGGSLALNAGAFGVIIAQLDLRAAVDPDAPTLSELETAFIAMRTELEKITDYKLLLVPMSSGTLNTTTAADIFFNQAVILSQPEYKQERTVIAALGKGTGYQAAATYAQNYAHERMVVPVVPDATVTVTGQGTTTYDMRFYNAALAGKLCSVPIGRTISDEIIPNISFEDNFTRKQGDYLVQRGVSPGKISGSVVRNILAITTDTTSALTEDLGVQDTADYIKKSWREGLWRVYKNSPVNTELLRSVLQTSKKLLSYHITEEGIISDFRRVAIRQDTVESRRLYASAQVMPAFCMQWMDITFTFVLSFSS
jgi:hypothetical protein